MKPHYLIFSLAMLLAGLTKVSAHAVQVAWCADANGDLQLFVEHWHGAANPNTTTMTISYIVNGTTTTTTGSPQGSYLNVPMNSLPGCASALTVFGSCPGDANTYDDWVQYSFPGVPCGVVAEIVVQSGNTVFTEDCGGMFPASTGPITVPCPQQPITINDQTVCSGTAFAPVNFPPQAGITYNWTNDNTAIGLPASGSGDIPAFTTPPGPTDVVANITVSYGTLTETFTYTALAAPTAAFNYAPFCAGDPVTFTDNSTPNNTPITTWTWDFGDGSAPYNGQNPPPHTYPGPGPYNATLTVDDGSCTNTIVVPVSASGNPTADFTSVPVCEGTATAFTDISTVAAGTITNWDWDFTSNNSVDATTQNPTNGYPSAGTYNATLTVTSDAGCTNSVTYPVVVNPIPVADFTHTDVCDGLAMNFTDQSNITNGTINTYAWNFGDGAGTSVQPSPNYTYAAAGNYNVTLTVTSDQGCIDDVTYPVEVFSTPVASFTNNDFCPGFGITFTDGSTNASSTINGWSWDLGDGSPAVTTQNVGNYLYAGTGPYNVTLTVTSADGCTDDFTSTVTANPSPTVDFTFDYVCEGTTTTFTANATAPGGNITGYEWDFTSDGVIDNTTATTTNGFPAAGDYNTTLTVTTDLGCEAQVSHTVTVNPVPTADFSVPDACDYLFSTFTNQSVIATGSIVQYAWDFGDGVGNSNLEDPLYQYGTAGVYNTMLTVTSDSGCIDNTTIPVNVRPKPVASFTSTDECLGTQITFNSTSNGVGTTITDTEWDYDGNTVIDDYGVIVGHTYGSYGTFNPMLIVTTQYGCKDSATNPVEVFEIPVANFSYNNECENDAIQFNNTSFINTGNITNYEWDFDNGNGSTIENPSEAYTTEGLYDVEFVITSNSGCTDTIVQQITVYPTPVAAFDAPAVCHGSITVFDDLSTVSNTYSTNSINTWNWDLDNNITFNGNSPTYLYPSDGTYNISLTVTTNRGCTHTITGTTTVNPNPDISFNVPDSAGCTEWCVTLNNTSSIASGNIASYEWSTGQNQSSTDINPSFCYTNDSYVDEYHDINVIATSDLGCTSEYTAIEAVTVFPLPLADFEPSTYVTDVYNTTIDFTDASIIPATFNWDIAGLETSTDPNTSYTFSDLDSGTYEICLEVATVNGCVHDTCKVVVINGYSNIYVPNAFTPDGDGLNDDFAPSTFGLQPTNYELLIFDRWGLLVYSTTNLLDAWDGTYKGQTAVQDVYIWKLRALDKYNGQQIKMQGHVTLLR